MNIIFTYPNISYGEKIAAPLMITAFLHNKSTWVYKKSIGFCHSNLWNAPNSDMQNKPNEYELYDADLHL